MKKQLFALTILCLSLLKVGAQTIQLLDTTGGNLNVAQTSYTFTVANGNAANFMFNVKNTSSSSINVFVKKYVISNPGGNLTTFCIGSLCYGSSTTQSGSVTIGANSTIPPAHATGTFGLSTDFDAFASTGSAQVMYTIFNAANTSDSVSVVLNYNLTAAAGIESINTNYHVSNVSPNPASNNISLNYDLKNTSQLASIKIYNMLGTLVKTVALETYTNNAKIDITSLEEGMYFYSVVVGGKTVKTSRLVVSR
jgi:hypothetical protein